MDKIIIHRYKEKKGWQILNPKIFNHLVLDLKQFHAIYYFNEQALRYLFILSFYPNVDFLFYIHFIVISRILNGLIFRTKVPSQTMSHERPDADRRLPF